MKNSRILILLIVISSIFLTSYFALLYLSPAKIETLHLRVGVYENAPKVFKDESGNWVGFWPDIVQNIAGKEGWTIEYVEGSWNECLTRLQAGEIDIMIDVAFSKERNLLYDFNNISVFSNWGVIYAREVGSIFDFNDLNNKTIAVMNNSIYTNGAFGMMNITSHFGINCIYAVVQNYTQVFEMIENKTADAGVVNRLFGMLYQDKYNVVPTSLIFNPSDLKFAFPKGAALNGYLIERIDDDLKAMQNDPNSIYYQSIARYFNEAVPVKETIPEWLILLVISVSIVGVVFILMSIYLKRIVNQKTTFSKERDRMEEKLLIALGELTIARNKAEEADKIKSSFLATMSHELRTPLNSIIGFTGILQQEMVGPLNEEQKKQLGMVRGSSSHLLNLINDVLDISKIEAGQMQFMKESFNLRESIEKIIQTIQPQAENKNLEVEVEIASGVMTITSDQRRVEQVILNLLSNAIKFIEHGKIRVECSINEGQVLVRVIDTGIGIKNEDMEKLFKPFRQIDAAITRKYEGTGLGLSICKKIIELLGGKIWVESEWGKGSTFSFTLPVEG